MDNSNKIILDLCGGTGAWSRPYKEAGYDVRVYSLPDIDVRLLKIIREKIYGVLAATPCTHLAYSGARWWAEKGNAALIEALSVADACIRIVHFCKPVAFWSLENPAGRLRDYYGEPTLKFNPYDFGDNYSKETWLWGEFNIPTPVALITSPIDKTYIHHMPPSADRATLRSITPPGFAQAFYESNP